MKERERNKRFMRLLDKLHTEGDKESIELLKTMVEDDTESMQWSFSIIKSETMPEDYDYFTQWLTEYKNGEHTT